MKFTPPPLQTPEVPRVRFLAAYGSTKSWEVWRGPVAAPVFIGRILRNTKTDWRVVGFPERRFATRMDAAKALL